MWSPTRQLRDQLPRIAAVPGLTRLRLAASSAHVVPALLREMLLDWVPTTVTSLEVDDPRGRRLTLSREPRNAWALT